MNRQIEIVSGVTNKTSQPALFKPRTAGACSIVIIPQPCLLPSKQNDQEKRCQSQFVELAAFRIGVRLDSVDNSFVTPW